MSPYNPEVHGVARDMIQGYQRRKEVPEISLAPQPQKNRGGDTPKKAQDTMPPPPVKTAEDAPQSVASLALKRPGSKGKQPLAKKSRSSGLLQADNIPDAMLELSELVRSRERELSGKIEELEH